MDLVKRFTDIASLMADYTQIWDREILHFFPDSQGYYPAEWLDLLESFSAEDLWGIDSRKNYSSLKGHKAGEEILAMVSSIQDLTQVDRMDLTPQEFERLELHNVKDKKHHEISKIATYLKELTTEKGHKRIVDIGGGVGHLSRLVSKVCELPAVCVDAAVELQDVGRRRNPKYPPGFDISYIHHKLSGDSNPDDLMIDQDTLSLGLHTCGPLALDHLNASLRGRAKNLLNFGCCYYKMDTTEHVNISELAKQKGVSLSNHALTLATRSHSEMTLEDFKLKLTVKTYRYALHFYLYFEHGISEFIGVGDCRPRVYDLSFAEYAHERLAYVNIIDLPEKSELQVFYDREDIQKLIRRLFVANIIRWQWGRLIENYILLDRAIYLQENGLDVQIMEFFDENISPRNIGIIGETNHGIHP